VSKSNKYIPVPRIIARRSAQQNVTAGELWQNFWTELRDTNTRETQKRSRRSASAVQNGSLAIWNSVFLDQSPLHRIEWHDHFTLRGRVTKLAPLNVRPWSVFGDRSKCKQTGVGWMVGDSFLESLLDCRQCGNLSLYLQRKFYWLLLRLLLKKLANYRLICILSARLTKYVNTHFIKHFSFFCADSVVYRKLGKTA
jgi:hypothetical protein